MPRDLPNDIIHPTIPQTVAHHSISLAEWKDRTPNRDYTALAVGAFIFCTFPGAGTGRGSGIESQGPVLGQEQNGEEEKEKGGGRAGKAYLLLLLRASTDSFPNVWEPPGGSVDLEDETIMHGLVREVYEETGLRVSAVLGQVWDGVYVSGGGGGVGEQTAGARKEVTFWGKRGDKWGKLNFVVECLVEKSSSSASSSSAGENQIPNQLEANNTSTSKPLTTATTPLKIRKGGPLSATIQLDKDEHQDWGWFDREEMERVPFISEQGREIARNAFDFFEEVGLGKEEEKKNGGVENGI